EGRKELERKRKGGREGKEGDREKRERRKERGKERRREIERGKLEGKKGRRWEGGKEGSKETRKENSMTKHWFSLQFMIELLSLWCPFQEVLHYTTAVSQSVDSGPRLLLSQTLANSFETMVGPHSANNKDVVNERLTSSGH
ncbi:hypothetical protein L345_06456, partial [Ophiophagus hannah]